jgi:hypothetical protein
VTKVREQAGLVEYGKLERNLVEALTICGLLDVFAREDNACQCGVVIPTQWVEVLVPFHGH